MFKTVTIVTPTDDIVIARDVIHNELASALVDAYCQLYNITDDIDAVAADINDDAYHYDFSIHGWISI